METKTHENEHCFLGKEILTSYTNNNANSYSNFYNNYPTKQNNH